MEKYLEEAFKAFDELNEDVFDISVSDGLEKAKEFNEVPVDYREQEIIIDPLAETEEELEKDYVGKAILQCEICQSMIYKDPSEVVIDEETELANIEEACPFCQSEEGFKVIGEIKEFCDGEECEEHEEEVEETEEDKVGIKEESLKINKRVLKESSDIELKYSAVTEEKRDSLGETMPLKDLLDLYWNSVRIGDEGYYKTEEGTYESFSGEDVSGDILNKLVLVSEEYDYDDDGYPIVFAEWKEEEIDESIKTRRKVRVHEGCEEELTESDKPAAISIEDAQKWVDYDMKRYGKISERTNRLVKKAGFQILKDDHGDYEVAAGKFENYNEPRVKGPRGTFRVVEKSEDELRKDGFGYHHTFETDGKTYDVFTKEDRAVAILKEDFERVEIETDREKMSMTSEENGKVVVTTEPKEEIVAKVEEKEEVIAPVSDEVRAEFKSNEEVAEGEPGEIDYDFDEFEEKDFDSLGEGFLKKVYENVKSFKTTEGRLNGNSLMLEGLITFKSGKQAKTNFVFEAYKATKTGKLKFIGENKQFAKGKKSFTLSGKADGKKLVCESLTYNYCVRDSNNNAKRLYGTIKK